MAALADHIHELHLNIHPGLRSQDMTVDDGPHAVAPGNEALPVQGGQDIPQLRAADAQLFRKNALPWQAVAVGVFSHLHSGQQLGTDAFGLRGLWIHATPPK